MALLLLSGLSIANVMPAITMAQEMPIARPSPRDPYAAHITEAAQRFAIPERWIRAVLRAESAGDVRAISSAGALGLMQVMPDTWAALRVRYRLGRAPYDPHDNIMAGAAYLREMWDRYGDVGAMLAAYNAGPGRYDDHRSTGRALPAETRAYVAALVPVLGGAAAAETSVRRADPPPDWREAAIFVVRSADAGSAISRSDNARSDDSRSPVTARPSDPAATSDSPLVIARSIPGDRR
ncbi:lytic transglycosylase domain-containing protein [Mesorhizobium sp. UC22_110]|jgi:hypothetical protein|uniref:lytic transglycosylase domain-containing protein n=1 Tax=unclassified Mesorhizobium TaxID=325217 RepID=UPI00366DF54C